jgi:3-methylcrotonyl-CoA carboxylase beta subunit
MFSRAGARKPFINSIFRESYKRSYHATVLPSLVSVTSPEFISKKEAMDGLVADFEAKTAQARLGGGAKAQEKMKSRGKLLPRERLALLLDPHTPFLELSSLAAQDVYSDYVPGAGLITGIGRVSGRECMIIVNDATVKGGSYYPLTVRINYTIGYQRGIKSLFLLGEETAARARDCQRAWASLCLHR